MSALTKLLLQKTQRKVPEIMVIFWVIKLFTTAMGESTSDYLVQTIDPVLAVGIGTIGFVVAIFLQLTVKKYIAWVYWLTVTMVAIFGTMAADIIHIGLGVPYLYSTLFFLVALAVIFYLWHLCEKTLSIHSIYNRRRELFYWATVLATFALGTAAGDMTATTFGLGYLDSIFLFVILIVIPLIGWKYFKMNSIVAFWFAYILTRPIGASFADWFGRSAGLGGIGVGTGKTSIILGILIIISVGYLTVTKIDVEKNAK